MFIFPNCWLSNRNQLYQLASLMLRGSIVVLWSTYDCNTIAVQIRSSCTTTLHCGISATLRTLSVFSSVFNENCNVLTQHYGLIIVWYLRAMISLLDHLTLHMSLNGWINFVCHIIICLSLKKKKTTLAIMYITYLHYCFLIIIKFSIFSILAIKID